MGKSSEQVSTISLGEGREVALLEEIGRGGFGTVYRGQLTGKSGLVKPVAVKLLNAKMTQIPEIVQRLKDEARLLAMLRHRCLVHVDDLVEAADGWAIVMEYIPGADLDDLLETQKIPARAACEMAQEVAWALHAAHTAKDPETGRSLELVHRDIKPANIRITPQAEVKVLDFGVARARFLRREAVTQEIAFGSVGYMSPERFEGDDLPASDVYALGLVLIECLQERVGQLSVKAALHLKRTTAVLEAMGQAPQELKDLLRACVEYEPDDRPSAEALARGLRDVAPQMDGAWLSDWAPEALYAQARTESPEPSSEELRPPEGHPKHSASDRRVERRGQPVPDPAPWLDQPLTDLAPRPRAPSGPLPPTGIAPGRPAPSREPSGLLAAVGGSMLGFVVGVVLVGGLGLLGYAGWQWMDTSESVPADVVAPDLRDSEAPKPPMASKGDLDHAVVESVMRGESLLFWASVSDGTNQRVTLWVRGQEGAWTSIPMELVESPGTFRARLDVQADLGTQFSYYIVARHRLVRAQVQTSGSPVDPHMVTVR